MCELSFRGRNLEVGVGLGVVFLPAKMRVYCEFLSSEGISAGIKMIKGFANTDTIHLMYAIQIIIKVPDLPCVLQ